MKFFLLLIFFPMYSFSQDGLPIGVRSGTTIFTVISDTLIVVVADSKRRDDNYWNNTSNYDTVCKIHSENEVVYGFAGSTTMFNPITGENIFNADDEMKSVLKNKQSFEDYFKLYNSVASSRLKDIYTPIFNSKNGGQFFDSIKTNGLFQIFMTGFINDKPNYISWYLTIVGDINNWKIIPTKIDNHLNENINPSRYLIGPLGHTDEILNFFKNGHIITNMYSVENLNFFMGLEINKNPNEVGEPIRILRIRKDNSIMWLQNPCQ